MMGLVVTLAVIIIVTLWLDLRACRRALRLVKEMTEREVYTDSTLDRRTTHLVHQAAKTALGETEKRLGIGDV